MTDAKTMTAGAVAVEPLAWLDGEFSPWQTLMVPATALGTAHASACFEGIRGYWSDTSERLYLFRLGAHVRRLLQSMKILRLHTPYSAEELEQAVVELLARTGWREDVYLRVLAFEATEIVGTFSPDARAGILIVAHARPSKLRSGRTKRCAVSSWRRVSDEMQPPRVKAVGNYLNSRYASLQAIADGYDDAIFLDQNGHVAEGSASCLFIVRDGVALTPPVSGDILEGITRDALLTLIREDVGVKAMERMIDRTELYVADEVFLCGTGGGEVSPVTSIDGYVIGNGEIGPLTSRIQETYDEVVHGARPERAAWLTPIGGERR